MKRILVFTLVAVLLLTPLDALQVLTHVRTLGTDPWMTPIKFAVLGAILAVLSYCLDPRPHPNKRWAIFFHGLSFATCYVITSITKDVNFLILFIAGNILAQSLVAWFDRVPWKETIPFALLLGIGGPLFEYIDVRAGGFSYIGFPDTIPTWLPLLWVSGAFLVRSLVGSEEINGSSFMGRFITLVVAPPSRAFATFWYIITNMFQLGLTKSITMGLRLYGWTKAD